MKTGMLTGFLALTLSVAASADIIPFLPSGNISGSGPYTWNYSATITQGESLNPAATNGNSCGGAPCNPAGTFFTIYDFQGYVNGSIKATTPDWGATTQLVGLTPQAINVSDNPTVTNLVFQYSGAVIAGPMTFTGFSADSIFNNTRTGDFSSQATRSVGMLAGATDMNTGNIPVPASAVPEPGYTLLLFASLSCFVLWRLKTRTT